MEGEAGTSPQPPGPVYERSPASAEGGRRGGSDGGWGGQAGGACGRGAPGARPRLWGWSPARGGLWGSLKQQRRRDWSGAPRADQRLGSLRVAAGLKTKSEPEGTLPGMLRAETSSPLLCLEGRRVGGQGGEQGSGRGGGGAGWASEEKAEDEGRPASPLRWVPGPQPAAPASLPAGSYHLLGRTRLQGGRSPCRQFRKKVRLPKDGGREDGRWGSGPEQVIAQSARQRAGPNLCPAGGRLLVSPGLTGRPRVGRHREGATFWPEFPQFSIDAKQRPGGVS